jgi:SSS family solute:Na+ symporter
MFIKVYNIYNLTSNIKLPYIADATLGQQFLQSHIGILDWIILVLYALMLLGIGWYYSYRQKNKEDYFFGGRSVSPFLSGISLYVSFFSAISYLAVPGEVIQYGPFYPLGVIIASPIIYLIACYFLIPFFMNLKITSAYEILQKPLGKKVRLIASSIFIVTRFLWMALLMFLAAKAMIIMLGWNESYIMIVILVLAVITILYTTMGGLKAVLMTDVIQFFILLIGAILTIGIVIIKLGGEDTIIPISWSDNWRDIDFFSFDPYVRLTIFFVIVDNITWWICTTGSDQMAIQRFLSTKDLKSARRTLLYTQLGQATIILLLMLVGFSVMRFYNTYPDLLPSGTEAGISKDFLFPHFIATQFPIGMSGLVIAALFSASMSSLSSGVNSMSSVLTTDILPKLFKNDKKVDSLINIRINSIFIGLIVILLSLIIYRVPGNIIEVTAKTNGLFIAPLFNIFFNALFVKNAKPFGVIMGSLYGLMTSFTIGFWDILTGNPSFSFLWIGISSLLISVISSLIFNSIFSQVGGRKAVIWGCILLVPWSVFYCFILS